MENTTLKITNPGCGRTFSPEAAIEAYLRGHREKAYALRNAESIKRAENRVKRGQDVCLQAS
jgi:hypothetical protein